MILLLREQGIGKRAMEKEKDTAQAGLRFAARYLMTNTILMT